MRTNTTYSDVRDVTRAMDDKPQALPAPLRTAHQFDAMGHLRLYNRNLDRIRRQPRWVEVARRERTSNVAGR